MLDEPVCPVCRSRERKLLGVYTVERAASHFCSQTRNPDRYARLMDSIRRLWPDGHCHVYECANCGFGYGSPHVGGDEDFYRITHEEYGYPSDRWEWGQTVDLCAGGGAEEGAVLDIGAGDGRFLSHLPGYWEKSAVEGSDITRDVLRKQGVDVFSSLDDPLLAGRRFSLITMFQVLEHIADFAAALQKCRELISGDGRLAISVPFGPAMVDQERLTGCADMPPNHINRWTPKSLTLALESAGFTVEEALVQPGSSWTFLFAVYLGVRSRAEAADSLAAQVYRIKNRKMRALALSLPAMATAMRLAPYWKTLAQGGSFLVVASPKA
jgi:2-polyprenyl-3-methyl-5-hydroxy-6-metoxy-1,4-benzoquinol methylase